MAMRSHNICPFGLSIRGIVSLTMQSLWIFASENSGAEISLDAYRASAAQAVCLVRREQWGIIHVQLCGQRAEQS
jgi:hypothetical protein